MGYDRGDSFPFDFETNGIPFGSKERKTAFHIEWDMIVVTVFLSISNQIEFHFVQNRRENCHHVSYHWLTLFTLIMTGFQS